MPELLLKLPRLTVVLQQITSGVSIKGRRVRDVRATRGDGAMRRHASPNCFDDCVVRSAARRQLANAETSSKKIDPVDQISVE
jgi:hypothetical protein